MNQELGHLSTVEPARRAAPGRIAVPAAGVSRPVLRSLNHNWLVRACPVRPTESHRSPRESRLVCREKLHKSR
jgi:hypothetical protein